MRPTCINPATEAGGRDRAGDRRWRRPTRRSSARARGVRRRGGAVAPGDRARLLRRFAAVVDAHLEELAELEVRNSGHTIGNARWEAGNVRDVLDYYAGAPERLSGRQIPVAGGVDVTFHEPLGVVGVIVPWNFPMPIAGWGFAPALAAGNTVVLKPAELTPLTAIRLGELALEAGLPEGVFTVLPGQGLRWSGERFVTHPAVRKICFTGSTEVGKRDHGGLRRPGEAGHPRAGRQERQHRLRRRRPGAGGRRRAVRASSTTPGRTAAPGPGCWSSARCTTGSWSCWSRRSRRSGWSDPALRDGRDGPADLGRRSATSVASYVDGADVAFRGALPDRRRASGSRRPCCWPTRRPTGTGARRSSARCVSVLPFDDEDEAVAAGQRHRVRPVRLDLDPRPRPGAAGGARRSRPAT